MYRIIALIFAGCIGLTGFTSYAQPGGDIFDEMMRSMASGGTSSGATSGGGSITEQFMGSTGPTQQQTSAIEEGQSLAVDVEVPEINQTVVEVIDTRTGRYQPRLKVNFHEFPLRSFAAKIRRGTEEKTHTDIVAQRIQSRLCVPNIELVVENRTATLVGSVATERQRNLAESMLRFEPGIDSVQNELILLPQEP
jgi:hypothetical protein